MTMVEFIEAIARVADKINLPLLSEQIQNSNEEGRMYTLKEAYLNVLDKTLQTPGTDKPLELKIESFIFLLAITHSTPDAVNAISTHVMNHYGAKYVPPKKKKTKYIVDDEEIREINE
jgi:hypothetical protein